MVSFERAFNDTENAAAATLKAASALVLLARQMQRAAQDGNINGLKRAADRLNSSLGPLRQEVANALASWPFQDEEEEQYLKDNYAAELLNAAAEKGLQIHERDGRLISHPSILRVLPGERAVRIDKKKVSSIRPSRLAGILVENQKKRPRFRPDAFLEAVYKAYLLLIGEQSQGRLIKERQVGSVLPLVRIHEVFTSLPGSSREYDLTDFARDIYFLEVGGTRQTKSGAQVSFPASTGTRSSRGTLSFVGPDGQVITYYGIQFSEGA